MAESKIYGLTRSAGSSLTRVRQVTPILKGQVAYPLYVDGFTAAIDHLNVGDAYEMAFIDEETGTIEGMGEIRVVTAAEVAKAKDMVDSERLNEMLDKYQDAQASLEEEMTDAMEALSACEETADKEGKDPEVFCASQIALVAELELENKNIAQAIAAIEKALDGGKKKMMKE